MCAVVNSAVNTTPVWKVAAKPHHRTTLYPPTSELDATRFALIGAVSMPVCSYTALSVRSLAAS